ncbi:TetR-like C-terminal domain-containing protein [Bacillus sp. SM2101]|uniref:TetR-like C-terminal domain-containing protein n=1 Tax=Bacillus sp. SM2101 TaxID=2805366 RepID=UPI00254746CE|nr:TetR-like C-terminal domain-containing protein [Bacillus sp. SM2101]
MISFQNTKINWRDFLKFDPAKSNKFKDNLTELGMEKNDLLLPEELLLHFASSAFIGVLTWWLKEEPYPSPEHMSKQILRIILKGPASAEGLKIDVQTDN